MGGDCCGRQIGGHVTNEGMSSQSCDTPRNAAALQLEDDKSELESSCQ